MSNTFKILFRDNSNAPNRELIGFIDNNLDSIIGYKYIFELTVVGEHEIANLLESGIEELPAMMFNDDIITGTIQIIEKIKSVCAKTPKLSGKEELTQDVQDFMQAVLDSPDDANPSEAEEMERKKRAEAYESRRNPALRQQAPKNTVIKSKFLEENGPNPGAALAGPSRPVKAPEDPEERFDQQQRLEQAVKARESSRPSAKNKPSARPQSDEDKMMAAMLNNMGVDEDDM